MSDYRPNLLDIIRGWFVQDDSQRAIVWWSDKIRSVVDPDVTTVPLAVLPGRELPDKEEPLPMVPRALWRTVTSHRSQVHGPDVSRHQGTVDWDAVVESGASFAFCKASEGYGYRDPRFDENWEEMKRVGLIRGAYHFARVNIANPKDSAAGRLNQARSDAYKEAKWFCDVVYPRAADPEMGDLPLVLDIEWDKKSNATPLEIVAFCTEFTNIVEARTGKKAIVYTGPSFWKYKMQKSLELAECHLWLVSGYKNKPGKPTRVIRGWDWTFDQYTNKRDRPDRDNGVMDWNVFRGTVRDLADLAGIPRDALPAEV